MAPPTSVIPEKEQSNYETFRECLFEPVLRTLAVTPEKPKRRRRGGKRTGSVKEGQDGQGVGQEESNDAEDLGEFIDVWKLSTNLLPACFIFRITTLPASIYSTEVYNSLI